MWPLTGHAEELRIIEAAISDQDLSGIVVCGAAGVGKSRVAREALLCAASVGCETRWAAGTSSARNLSLGASRIPATACAEPKKWNERGYEACAVQAEKDWRSGSIDYKTFRELVEGCCHLPGEVDPGSEQLHASQSANREPVMTASAAVAV